MTMQPRSISAFGGVRFRGGVRPGADELDLHGRARAEAARAQIVSGEAGNDLREGVRAPT